VRGQIRDLDPLRTRYDEHGNKALLGDCPDIQRAWRERPGADATVSRNRRPVRALTMLLACAMFGLSLIASLVVITQSWQRLVRYSGSLAALVPYPHCGSCSARSGSPSPLRTCSAGRPT
jgi:hypothetical protein